MYARKARIKMTMIGHMTQLGSVMAGLAFTFSMLKQWLPPGLWYKAERLLNYYFSPYVETSFQEYLDDGYERSRTYAGIERYLGTKSFTQRAKYRKANVNAEEDCESVVFCMDDYEEVWDEFRGVKLWWSSYIDSSNSNRIVFSGKNEQKRFYKLTCRRGDEYITEAYIEHVMSEAKAATSRSRQRRLYVNNRKEDWDVYDRYSMWSHVVFNHPATFDTLAMDPRTKQEIIEDLITFTESEDYYKHIGKTWKRGYLLYGPPGTGKSSMIAAMANLLKYDIYDIELTAVANNIDLRKLLMRTSPKSIIVIEDIDCSLDLTGKRTPSSTSSSSEDSSSDDDEDGNDETSKASSGGDSSGKGSKKGSKVTLSGLLNFIDGLWSVCGSERLIVFTTNHVDKLDPALIRSGRMDKHIELSYCRFEAFKALAKNYLGIDSHELFPTIGKLLEETNMIPADVAGILMPKSAEQKRNPDICLENLIEALDKAKTDAAAKIHQEQEGAKAEKDQS